MKLIEEKGPNVFEGSLGLQDYDIPEEGGSTAPQSDDSAGRSDDAPTSNSD